MTIAKFRCATCNAVHDGVPDLTFGAPYYLEELSEAERASRGRMSDDLCSLDNEHFFIRAVLEIPIVETGDKFGWGVWVSLSEANFRRYIEFFSTDPPEGEGPYFGWLSNRLPGYPDTLSLKTHVHLQPSGSRPLVELEHTDHPLAQHQHHGIGLHELSEIVSAATEKTPNVFGTRGA